MEGGTPGAERKLPVAILASYPAVRAGLRALLSAGSSLEIVAEASDPGDLRSGERARVVVAELESDRSGALVREIVENLPDAGVVLLGPPAGAQRLLQILADRAWAYLLRDAGADDLIQAVAAVAQGLVVLPPPLARQLLVSQPFAVLSDESVPQESLTNREQEVLQLVAQGLPNKTIAHTLGISEHTVKFHVTSILTKLDASSRTEAVRLGARRGLIVL